MGLQYHVHLLFELVDVTQALQSVVILDGILTLHWRLVRILGYDVHLLLAHHTVLWFTSIVQGIRNDQIPCGSCYSCKSLRWRLRTWLVHLVLVLILIDDMVVRHILTNAGLWISHEPLHLFAA